MSDCPEPTSKIIHIVQLSLDVTIPKAPWEMRMMMHQVLHEYRNTEANAQVGAMLQCQHPSWVPVQVLTAPRSSSSLPMLRMAPVLRPLPLTWETRMDFRVPGLCGAPVVVLMWGVQVDGKSLCFSPSLCVFQISKI